MVKAQTPTIAKIKNGASETDARALISLAICEVCDFFNVGKNMNDTQIAMTVDLIIESFWYLKLEEIKYCFRRAMRTEKVFDRLDGNIILGWLEAYDKERTEEAMRLSEHDDGLAANGRIPDEGTMTFDEYVSGLRIAAGNGDESAAETLKSIEARKPLVNPVDERQRELDFKTWFYTEYLPSRQTK